jgi:site-specific DNA-methyltransferase (adenine-specific)
MTDDFLALTLDVWDMPTESARRVGHPAPFPVELPEQLIRLYTFEDDLVLDPFMGSGSALVAAARLGRRYVGYDLDPQYVEIARRRVAEATRAPHADLPTTVTDDGPGGQKLAEAVLTEAGFTIAERGRRVRGTGVTVGVVATDADGQTWFFDVGGGFKSHRGGLFRTDAVWRTLGRANALRRPIADGVPLVLLTTQLPKRPSEGDSALRAAGPSAFFDAIDVLSADARARLAHYAKGGTPAAETGFWTEADLARRP